MLIEGMTETIRIAPAGTFGQKRIALNCTALDVLWVQEEGTACRQPGDTPAYFGGLTQREVVGPTGLHRLGIDKAEPIITSVVMLDAAQYINNGNALAPGYAITPVDIEHILAAQGLANRGIKAGDVGLIHTGYGAAWARHPSTYYTQGPGLSHDAAVSLAAKQIVLVGLDNPFTDAAVQEPGVGPFPPMPSWEHGNNSWLPFGVHHHLTQAGVHQIQNLHLTEMAQKKIHLGAVFILPVRLKGGAGSPVRPVVKGTSAKCARRYGLLYPQAR